MGESRNAYRVLVGRPERKRPLGRPRRRWEDNIKMDMREVEYDDREWINLAQDRDQWRACVTAAMDLRSLMLAGIEFQSLGRAIVKEDEYEEVRWDGIVSIVSWREHVFRLWWEERIYGRHASIPWHFAFVWISLIARRMYWEIRPDSHNILVANCITRNKFETVHHFLHFNHNNTIDKNDRIYKLRPLFNRQNEMFQNMVDIVPNSYSVDEAMEPYFSHHSIKHFIRGKTIKFEYKASCLTTPAGYLIKFEPYTGRVERAPGMTLGNAIT
ncbi:hypothetical protein ANN_19765 [Periplaneta americana]|uniref:PiggyBac transposable element-derived protein domain-containing protein n=1 Tax=Periplaneta americana TaxID=6978 RepID=A0ABQ8SB60_PERAM|nr:hypothetical protein ANN_19765 [Periplaneta americana]